MSQLHVTVTAPLPEDHWESSDILAKIKPHIDQLKSALAQSGVADLSVNTQVGNPKAKPGRKAKPAAVTAPVAAAVAA